MLLCLFVEAPKFLARIQTVGTMHAEHRAEGAELEPAREQLLILRICGIAIARGTVAEEAARVGVPIRNAGERKIQPGRNLSYAEPARFPGYRPTR